MTKFIQFKDTKVMRGSKLFELLTSNDPKDKLEAEALYKQISAAHDKHWDPKYNYLKNYVPSY